MTKSSISVPIERIERAIVIIRGQKVMLDSELAVLYEVPTKALNQAVRRNPERFPDDFMFRLTRDETVELNRSQIVTGPQKHRDPRFPPFAFTEQGVAMLSSVLRSERAAVVNIAIMRAFVHLRELLTSNADLARKFDDLEKKYDRQFRVVFDAIRQLMAPPTTPRKPIGFAKASRK